MSGRQVIQLIIEPIRNLKLRKAGYRKLKSPREKSQSTSSAGSTKSTQKLTTKTKKAKKNNTKKVAGVNWFGGPPPPSPRQTA